MTDPFLDMAEQNVQRLKYMPRTHHDMLENARLAVEYDPVLARLRFRGDEDAQEIMKAIRLANTLPVARALLRGETVPRSSVDPQWLKAYGL